MTNQEWLCKLSAKDFLNRIKWLLQNYGKRWTDSDSAIIEWLQGKHEVNTPEDKGMTRENAILCLKGIKNYGRDTFTEQSDWQESLDMAIKALEQNEGLNNMVKMGIAKDCESCRAHRVEVLEKIEAEIDEAYEDLDGYDPDSLGTLACRIGEIIDKYKIKSKGGGIE